MEGLKVSILVPKIGKNGVFRPSDLLGGTSKIGGRKKYKNN